MSDEREYYEAEDLEASQGGPTSEGTNMLHARREKSKAGTAFQRIATPLAFPATKPWDLIRDIRTRPVMAASYTMALPVAGATLAYVGMDAGDTANPANIAWTALDFTLDGFLKTSLFALAAYSAGHVLNWFSNKNFSDFRMATFGMGAAFLLSGYQALDGNDKGVENLSVVYTNPGATLPLISSHITDRIAPTSQGTNIDAYVDAGEVISCRLRQAQEETFPSWFGCRALPSAVDTTVGNVEIKARMVEPVRPTNVNGVSTPRP